MAESEFLSECRRLIDTYSKGHGLCCEIQSDLNDDYRDGRIPYGEWKEKTEENERRKTFFREQIDIFSDRLECLKKTLGDTMIFYLINLSISLIFTIFAL